MPKPLILTAALFLLSFAEGKAQTAESDSFFAAGVAFYQDGKYREAIPLFAQCDSIDKATLPEGSNRLDYAAMWIASCYYLLGDTTIAQTISNYYDVDPVDRRLTVESDALSALAGEVWQGGDGTQALQYATRCAEIEKSVLGEDHPWYANSIDFICVLLEQTGDFKRAISYRKQKLTLDEKIYGKESIPYGNDLFFLCSNSLNLKDYDSTVEYGVKALSFFRRMENEEAEACTAVFLGIGYCEKQEYAAALQVLEPIMNRVEIFPDICKHGLRWLAKAYGGEGRYSEALHIGLKALPLYEEDGTNATPVYAAFLNELANYYSMTGNNWEAIEWQSRCVNLVASLNGKISQEYAKSLEDLSTFYYRMDDYENARTIMYESLAVYELSGIHEGDAYTGALCNMARISVAKRDYVEAASFYQKALDASSSNGQISSISQLTILHNISLMVAAGGMWDTAILAQERSLSLAETLVGTGHPGYAEVITRLLMYCIYGKRMDAHRDLSEKVFQINLHALLASFSSQTAKERTRQWKAYRNVFETVMQMACYNYPNFAEGVICGYNSALLSKGLLLNSEIEFSKLIQESGDEEALGLFKELQARRSQINKLIEKPIADRPLDVDSLSREADKVEQQLVERSKVYGDFTKNLVITWPQVQEKLGDKDAAVEFVSFRWNADSTMYIAYVLRKDWDCPRMIPLFEEKELEAVKGYDYYTTPSLSHLVWEPIDAVMEGVDHVYFSPGGDLYNIAIESVPDHLDPAHIVSDRRDYYRLSSTRELALIQDDYTWTEGAVYGGLNYNMGVSSLAADEAHYAQSSPDSQRERGVDLSYYYLCGEDFAEGIRSDRKSSGLLDSLPGTREEAVAIKAQLDDISVPSSLYTDDLGTEASFKALDGQRTSIIHIGTHGFFNTKETEYQDPTSLLMTSSQQSVRVEDDALSRSGLCMAGANNLLTNAEALPDSLDDGWLTALEIAHLDLRGLDMVVLSACKTGVGEVTGDGVFGLQRGFKKAGARTLVMSLWNVPDQLTCYFMKEFFARISVDANGHPTNKHAAFLQAQQAARTHWQEVDPLAAPYDWAAFILLDGVD